MKALILAAGYATRLYPITKDTPKPLLKLQNRPIIDYIIDKIEQIGDVNHIYVVSNNKFYGQFEAWMAGKLKERPHFYTLINDGSNTVEDRLGAIGDINLVIEKESVNDDLLVVAGDNLFDFNLNDLVNFSREKQPYHSICLYLPQNGTDLTRFGIVQLNEFTQVIGLDEKPQSPKSNLIATCIYFMPKEKLSLIAKYLGEGHHNDTPGSYMSWLVENDKVYGKICDGTWFDLGDFEALSQAVIYLNSTGTVPVNTD